MTWFIFCTHVGDGFSGSLAKLAPGNSGVFPLSTASQSWLLGQDYATLAQHSFGPQRTSFPNRYPGNYASDLSSAPTVGETKKAGRWSIPSLCSGCFIRFLYLGRGHGSSNTRHFTFPYISRFLSTISHTILCSRLSFTPPYVF